jgi:ABC-type transporter Mla maintaining outer membrane lipid asymmetry ATPase subunit MlaF
MCLARTLVTDPEVLLLDEPTSSVDPGATAALERLARVLLGAGVVCIWVTHDLAQMRRLADRVLVVLDGVIAHSGSKVDLERDAPPKVAAFLAGDDAPRPEAGTATDG